MNLRRVGCLFCAALITVAIAACGSSSNNSSNSSQAAASSTGAAASSTGSSASGAPIKIGMVCSCSGAAAPTVSGDDAVMKAWADSVNASGGLNGHPVQMTTYDDSGSPAASLLDVKKLIQENHVIAIVGDYSVAESSWVKYVDEQGIPVIGGYSVSPEFGTDPNWYPSGSGLVVTTVGLMQAAKEAGGTNAATTYCAEAAVCAEVVPLAKFAAEASGMKWVTAQKVSSTAPSYVAPCLSLKNAAVNVIYPALTASVANFFVNGCAQQGYKPHYAVDFLSTAASNFANANFDGAVGAAPNANPEDTSLPAVAAFQQALHKYAPSLTGANLKYTMISEWAAGKLFQDVAKAADLGPNSTPADVKKGLYMIKDDTLGGLSGPLTFVPGKPTVPTCFFNSKVAGGKLVSENDNKASCLNSTQIKGVQEVLKSF